MKISKTGRNLRSRNLGSVLDIRGLVMTRAKKKIQQMYNTDFARQSFYFYFSKFKETGWRLESCRVRD